MNLWRSLSQDLSFSWDPDLMGYLKLFFFNIVKTYHTYIKDLTAVAVGWTCHCGRTKWNLVSTLQKRTVGGWKRPMWDTWGFSARSSFLCAMFWTFLSKVVFHAVAPARTMSGGTLLVSACSICLKYIFGRVKPSVCWRTRVFDTTLLWFSFYIDGESGVFKHFKILLIDWFSFKLHIRSLQL